MPSHTAIVSRRLRTQLPAATLFVPLLGLRRAIALLGDAAPVAAESIAAATAEPVTADEVEVLIAYPGDILLPSVPTPTEVCHPEDRRWYRGTRVAWASQFGRWWRPVVTYAVGPVQWERIVAPGFWRLDRGASGRRNVGSGNVAVPLAAGPPALGRPQPT